MSRYLGLRLFAVSWGGWSASDWRPGWDGDPSAPPPRSELERALSAFRDLNRQYVASANELLRERGL